MTRAGSAKISRSSAVLVVAMLAAVATSSIVCADDATGPVSLRTTPCLVAQHAAAGPRCEVPPVRTEGPPAAIVASRLSRARHYIDLQDLAAARREVDAALAAAPNAIDGLHLSARLALTSGMVDIARAERDLAAARALAPHDPDIRATYAHLLRGRPAFVEAKRELDAILTSHPNHVGARSLRARLLLSMQRPRDAIRDLDVAVAADPSRENDLVLLAETHMALDEPRAAIAAYNAALDRAPGQYSLLIGRIAAYARAGDDAGALRDLDTILGDEPTKPRYAIAGDQLGDLLMQRALIHRHGRRFDRAAADAAASIVHGGVQSILRAQVFLRHNGFPETPLDGRFSEPFRRSIKACFGLDACFQTIMHRT